MRPAVLPAPLEAQHQRTLIQWVETQRISHPALALLYAIPNGELRNVITARRLKAQGVRPGVPDLCLPVQRQGYAGLYIELKRGTGGQVGRLQHWWHDRLRAEGCRVEVCAGWTAARDVLLDYLTRRGG